MFTEFPRTNHFPDKQRRHAINVNYIYLHSYKSKQITMTLLQLSYVLELNRQKSFSKAAKMLKISQPALSLQIGKLEKELGIKLFNRTALNVELTNEGEIFAERCAEVLQMVDNLQNLPIELENEPKGILTVGIIPTLAPYWIPLFIDDFQQKYAEINVKIIEMKTEDIISSLKSGAIDAGFLSTPVVAKGIEFMPLFYERFYLFVSNKHKLANSETIDLSKVNLEEVWYLEEGNCFQNQVNSVCSLSGNINPVQNFSYLSNSIESLCKIVESGHGLTFIPELATLSIPADQEEMIKEISGSEPVREISIATTRMNKSDLLIKIFLDEALKPIPKRMQISTSDEVVDTGMNFTSI